MSPAQRAEVFRIVAEAIGDAKTVEEAVERLWAAHASYSDYSADYDPED